VASLDNVADMSTSPVGGGECRLSQALVRTKHLHGLSPSDPSPYRQQKLVRAGFVTATLLPQNRMEVAMGAELSVGGVTIFWMQILTSIFVCLLVMAWYAWPSLRTISRKSALIILLFVHVPRYVGMTLLVPGMVDPKLPSAFLSAAAYGDLLEAALALASIYALRSNWRVAIPMVWVTNSWGFLDLLNGMRGILTLNVPSFNLATLWYIYTFYAPLVLVSHLMIFRILLSRSWKE
jgi:hypothetical protein